MKIDNQKIAEIINIDDAIKMIETIISGLIVTIKTDLSAWLGLSNNEKYTVVEDLGLRWSGNRRGFERYYRVINDAGDMVDVSESYCSVSIKDEK